MSMVGRINTNVEALFSIAQIHKNENSIATTLQRLSTGLKINKAADDPSNLVIGIKLRSKIGELNSVVLSLQGTDALLSVADAALMETADTLIAMKELAARAANDATLTTADRKVLDNQFQAMIRSIDARVQNTEYNGKKILTGSVISNAVVWIGPDALLTIDIDRSDPAALSLQGQTISTFTAAVSTLTKIENGLSVLGRIQANVGVQQRLVDMIINEYEAQNVGYEDAASKILNADIAEEITNLVKTQLLNQTAVAALLQANIMPQTVLKLME